eukprot:SAG31_NODE_14599_length_797_cov_1.167622_2_plen_22_part_01
MFVNEEPGCLGRAAEPTMTMYY